MSFTFGKLPKYFPEKLNVIISKIQRFIDKVISILLKFCYILVHITYPMYLEQYHLHIFHFF